MIKSVNILELDKFMTAKNADLLRKHVGKKEDICAEDILGCDQIWPCDRIRGVVSIHRPWTHKTYTARFIDDRDIHEYATRCARSAWKEKNIYLSSEQNQACLSSIAAKVQWVNGHISYMDLLEAHAPIALMASREYSMARTSENSESRTEALLRKATLSMCAAASIQCIFLATEAASHFESVFPNNLEILKQLVAEKRK